MRHPAYTSSAQAVFYTLALFAAGCASPLDDFRSHSSFQHQLTELTRDLNLDANSNTQGPSSAQLPEHHIELEDLLVQAQRANHSLKATRFEQDIARSRTRQAGLYPNPRISIGIDDAGSREGLKSAETRIEISQPIVIGGRLNAATRYRSSVENTLYAQYEDEEQTLFASVAQYQTRLIVLRDRIQLIDELIVLAQETHSIAQARFEARAASEPEAIRSRVEILELRTLKNQTKSTISIVEKQLGMMLGLDSIASARLADSVEFDPPKLNTAELKAKMLETHPRLRASTHEIRAAKARLEQIKSEITPDLELQTGFGYNDETDQGIAQIGVGMQIPLWDRRQGDTQAARFDILRLHQMHASLEVGLITEFVRATGEYEAARDQLLLLRDQILPDLQQAFVQTEQAYKAGSVPFIELLEAQRTLVRSRLLLIEHAGHAALARVQVARVAGIESLLSNSKYRSTSPTPTTSNTISTLCKAKETP